MTVSARDTGGDQQRVPMGGGESTRVVSPRLIGRDEELDQLTRAVSNPPTVVVVEGEAGVGKTRLIGELQSLRGVADRRLLAGSCQRIREPFPLGPIIDALRNLGDLPTDVLSPVAGVLRPLLPELADKLPEAPATLDDRDAERHRVFRSLVEVIGAIDDVVVVLEDLHWADDQTIDFLTYLFDAPPSQLSLILTYRGEEADPVMRAVTTKLPAEVQHTHIHLPPLDVSETGELAAAILDTDHISDEFATLLRDRTAGLPFAIEEVVALLRAREDLIIRGRGWVRRTLDELDLPSRIRDSVLERFSRLSVDARAIVEAAAVLQTPHPTKILTATALIQNVAAPGGIEEAMTSGVLVESQSAIGFRHLLAAQAVYEDIPAPRRERLHAQAAAALKTTDPVPLGQLAHHLQHANHVAEWVDVAEQAADQALELAHEDQAVLLLEDVLGTALLDVDQRSRLAVKLARAAMETPRNGPRTIDLLKDALEQCHPLPRVVRGELRFRTAMISAEAGTDMVLERRMLLEAVDDLVDRPDLRAWAMVCLGTPLSHGESTVEHLKWLHHANTLIPEIDDTDFETFLLGKTAMVLVCIGDPDWLRISDTILQRTASDPSKRHEIKALYSIAMDAIYAGHYEVGERLLRPAMRGARASENVRLELAVRSVMTLLDYCRGAWSGLHDEVHTLIDKLDELPRYRVYVDFIAGSLTLSDGSIDDATNRLAATLQTVNELGESDLLPMATAAIIRVMLAGGHVEDAAGHAEQYLRSVEEQGVWAVSARALPRLVCAMVAAEDEHSARDVVGHFAKGLRNLDAPLGPAALTHAQGYLEKPSRAARLLLQAAAAYDRLVCPYEAAQTREEAAVSMFATGDNRAKDTLHSALAAYERLGTRWDWHRAAKIGRSHDIDVTRPWRGGRRGYGDQLSPREQEVAELAAQGHTNKQIAEELFISPKTVEAHMRSVRRKLNVPSRAAIGGRLTELSGRATTKNRQHP